ncbi:MAG TPA: serine/threonine-protein kinase, partial [Nevskiaceae bacterium]|nr:serine/threonine-protein kinase [Nevskiaceae bacterium]
MSEGAGPQTKLWREAFDYFERIADLTQGSHEAELRKVEAERPDLYPHVVTLVRAHQEVKGGDFMTKVRDASIDDLRRAASTDTMPGREIGPYRLERQLGRGGMGEVWLARRADGLFEAPVALKLLHPHLEASAIRDRFVREGKILGQLSHPHIARLLDAGSLPGSRLYLAIEYVEGERIDLWCDVGRLTVEARVRLFLQVCEAVAHAHTRLVVHRDLKPSNIMVTSNGEVKLLDFGIAKLIESEETSSEATDLTRVGGRVMTPEYAAPEQILGAPVTTATDVYSLGMVLYVLLTGRRPYGAEGASLQQIEREAVELDPDPPSHFKRATGAVTATDAASLRGMTGTQLRSALRGDLDTIVLKALKKAPAERYASVADFGEDLRRFVENRPVLAQPDSAGYRFRKFVRRNRVGVAAGAAVALASVVGVGGVVYQAREARIAQHAAEAAQAQAVENAERVKRSKAFFVQVFSSASPIYRKGEGAQTVQEALDQAIASVDRDLADDPRFQGDLLSDLGEIRAGQGDFEGAKAMFERALALHEKSLAPDDPALANTLTNRGVIDSYLYDAAAGIPYLERALRILEPHADTEGEQLAATRSSLSNAYWMAGKLDQALELQQLSLEHARAAPGAHERILAVALTQAGLISYDRRQFAESKRYFHEARAVWERNYGADTYNLWIVFGAL